MQSKKTTTDLIIALQSEIYGEASFRSAYYVSAGAKKEKAQALWALEKQTKVGVLEYYRRHNIPLPRLVLPAIKGSLLGLIFPIFPWKIILHIIRKETDYYLHIFRRLEGQANEDDKAFFKYLVAHEVAIKQFAEFELDNKPDEALRSIKSLLKEASPQQLA